ncbi:Galactose oxidase/kelch beta-propeller [Arabidopsis suecica]|uniref:Galactose oxidase/kelch beta-propeller n=1 Tax=Arabidopsis suecica TaxID=45249 RepID=A0A8T1XSD4_ARASU|nr:Galactose oxidase/kelch beta-propeller [Arabidopsis suecica]
MNSFTEDLWSIILARLPLKSITTSKLVCKQWKSIVESPYFRKSLYQNLHSSSWSLLVWDDKKDLGTTLYGCEPSIGSYISSFLNNKFEIQRHKYEYLIWDYTDVGLILISEVSKKPSFRNSTVYVANPVSQDCVKLPSHLIENVYPLGIVTRTENGVVLDYKVVLLAFGDVKEKMEISLLIYSSETGLWSLSIVHLPSSLYYGYFFRSISLNGNLYWLNRNSDNEDVIVSHDFYATGTDSDRFRVTRFPDSGKHPKFKRACTIFQGFLMYMNVVSITKDDGSLEDKLIIWKLKSGEWQLVSEISADFVNPGFDHIPVTINSVDAKTVYFWNRKHKSLVAANLCNGKFVLHSELEHSGRSPNSVECIIRSDCPSFVLPRWLYP